LVMGKEDLLSDINLHMNAGELTAIIGPSGAGKSTIMKVLSGHVIPTSGRILLNNSATHALSEYRSLIGYVPQEDVMNPLYTVRENIVHSAMMRLPASMESSKKEQLADRVILALGLAAKQHVVVGDMGGRSSLSGAFLLLVLAPVVVIVVVGCCYRYFFLLLLSWQLLSLCIIVASFAVAVVFTADSCVKVDNVSECL
jgi:ABC-type cobalamin/Fe3+-siderophores transport system ATPase subunit